MELKHSIFIAILSTVVFFSMIYLHEYAHKVAFETVGCETEMKVFSMNPYTSGTCTVEQHNQSRLINMLIDALGYTITPFLVILIILKIIEITND